MFGSNKLMDYVIKYVLFSAYFSLSSEKYSDKRLLVYQIISAKFKLWSYFIRGSKGFVCFYFFKENME